MPIFDGAGEGWSHGIAMGVQLKDAKNKDTGEIETSWSLRASVTTEVKR